MIGEELIERKPVSLPEVRAILRERKREKELTYEQEQAYKYSRVFSKITKRKRKRLFKKLIELDSINERIATKILDIMPWEPEIMKLIPLKDENVKEEDLKKAFEIIKKYAKKSKK